MSHLSLDTTAIGHKRSSVRSIMLQVVLALLPGIIFYALFIDSRVILNLLIASACALLFEAVFVRLRNRSVLRAIGDGSIILAALLLVLSVPQSLPTWQLVFGVLAMCALGKHMFGGLGHNPFNPAMVAYAVLIVSFPLTMIQWSSDHGWLDSGTPTITVQKETSDTTYDAISRATPLDRLATEKRLSEIRASDSVEQAGVEHQDTTTALNGTQLIVDSDWFWLNVCWLLGGLYLLYRRVISWHVPVTMLATVWIAYVCFGWLSSSVTLSASSALFSGAILFGAFFIATDPVSGATSRYGRVVYALGIGLLTFFIREFSDYPEGVAFAVLLMNMSVPLIDHAFTRKRPVVRADRSGNNRSERSE